MVRGQQRRPAMCRSSSVQTVCGSRTIGLHFSNEKTRPAQGFQSSLHKRKLRTHNLEPSEMWPLPKTGTRRNACGTPWHKIRVLGHCHRSHPGATCCLLLFGSGPASPASPAPQLSPCFLWHLNYLSLLGTIPLGVCWRNTVNGFFLSLSLHPRLLSPATNPSSRLTVIAATIICPRCQWGLVSCIPCPWGPSGSHHMPNAGFLLDDQGASPCPNCWWEA